MLHFKPFILTLFIISISSYAMVAQEPPFINYTTQAGLPSNNVYSVVQDKLGYIWITTENGLVKYNGYDFKVFTTKDGLPSNDIWRISEDNNGNIWVFCSFSKQVGFIKDDKYHTAYKGSVIISYKNLFHKGDTTIFDYSSGDGVIGERSIVIYNSKTEKAAVFDFPEMLNKQTILPIDREMNIVVVDSNNRLNLIKRPFSQSKDQQWLCDSLFDFFHYFHVSHLVSPIYNSTFLTYRFLSDSIYVIKPFECDFKKIPITDFNCKNAEGAYVLYHRDRGGGYILVTNKQVVLLDDDLDFEETLLGPNEYKKLGSQVAFLAVDNEKNKWYATKENGAFVKPWSARFFMKNNQLERLSGLSLASNEKLETTYWLNSKTRTIYEVKKSNIVDSINMLGTHPNVCVSEYEKGRILSISTPESFTLFDKKSKKLIPISRDKKITYNGLTVAEHNKQITIVAGKHHWYNDSLLYLVEQGFNRVSVFKDSINLRTNVLDEHSSLKGLYFDKSRTSYWIYNNSVLNLYNHENNRHIKLDWLQDVIPNLHIKKITGDDYGNIYLYNSDQLYLLYPELGIVKRLNEKFSALYGDICVSGDTLVLAGYFGIAYAKINGVCDLEEFRIVPNTSGFAYAKIHGMSYYQGLVTISTDKGVYNIDIKDSSLSELAYNAGQSMHMRLYLQSPFEKEILGSEDTIKIDQSVQQLKIDVVNISAKGKPQYKYDINGLGQNVNTSGEVFVGNLKAGTVHTIRCKVYDDIWSTDNKVFHVYRDPYWYQTNTSKAIFWSVGILGIIGLVFITVGLTRFVVARNAEKRQQMTDLQLRAIYSQINPHFIFNSLASALYFIDEKKFDDAYNHVNKFSKLLRSYLKSSQERYIVLEEEISMLKNYIELQQTRFEDKFEYSIEIDKKIPTGSILIPSLLLQPIVENAINHGLFHLVKNGKLLIRFNQGENSDELICTIDDNGVGRKKAGDIKKQSSDKRESYGTQLTEKLIDVFKTYEHMNVSMKYIDKSPPKQGTIVILTIKNLKYVV